MFKGGERKRTPLKAMGKKVPRPEKLKPVNRKARRAIKSGRKHSEKQSMEKSAAGTHD